MIDLYHGTIYDFEKIDIGRGKGYKDFGQGFYATSVKSHAENIARRNKRIIETRETRLRNRNPKYKMGIYQAYRYNLEFDNRCIDNPEGLRVKIFKEANNEWVRFVLKNRESNAKIHDYDIVIGPTADENTVTIINSYREELLATDYADDVLNALIKELEPENLPKQYYFGTEVAVRKLRFKRIKREIVG